jgi:hypothetical protein
VEGLIPELLLGLRAEHAIPRAGQRRTDHERPRPFGKNTGDGLGGTAADVIAGQYRAAQPQLVDQACDAARLRGGRVGIGGRPVMLVRLAEAAQVRRDHLGRGGQPGDDVAEVGAVAGPAVQQDDRRARASPVVGQPEPVNLSAAWHRPSL